MITRSLALRQGRIAIPKPSTRPSIRQWRRALSYTTRRNAQEQQEPLQQDDESQQVASDRIVDDWDFFQHQRAHTGNVGATVTRQYKPADLMKRPPRPEDITLELLLASQTHLGHRTSLWHPANSRYIFGTWGQTHDAIHVISLDVTAAHLRRACRVVSGVAAKGGLILFVGTRDGQAMPVVRAASLAGGYHLFDKWTPGTLTNAQQILGKCQKKVINAVDEDVPGFETQLVQRAAIKPDLVVCLNPLENYVLLHECGLHGIPTIGIIDTDVNPTWVTYPIPANDDSLRSVSVIAGALGHAGEAGRALRLKRARGGQIDFAPARDLRVPTKDEIQAAKRTRSKTALDDVDDDEELILTPSEEALLAQEDVPLVKKIAEQELDDSEEASQESDEALVSLTDFSEDQSSAPKLSEEDLTNLANTVQQNAGDQRTYEEFGLEEGEDEAITYSEATPDTSDTPAGSTAARTSSNGGAEQASTSADAAEMATREDAVQTSIGKAGADTHAAKQAPTNEDPVQTSTHEGNTTPQEETFEHFIGDDFAAPPKTSTSHSAPAIGGGTRVFARGIV